MFNSQNDHYVSKTYLKNFTFEKNKLHTYRKQNGEHFTPVCENICCQKDGDILYWLEGEEKLWLRKKLQLIETQWPNVIENLQNSLIGIRQKWIICQYLAMLEAINPANLENKQEMASTLLKNLFRHWKESNLLPPLPQNCNINVLEDIKIDEDFVKFFSVKETPPLAANFFQSPWELLLNNTNVKFLTSDNPLAVYYPNFAHTGHICARYFPLTPEMAVLITPDPHIPLCKAELKVTLSSLAKDHTLPVIKQVFETEIKKFNQLIIKCSNRYVFSQTDHPGLSEEINQLKNYRMQLNTRVVPLGKASLVKTQLEINPLL